MPKITQQVSSRVRTSTRRLPHSPWPSLSTTFCNLIVPLQYNHHYHTLTYLLTPKPDSSTFPAFAHTTARPFPHFHSTPRAPPGGPPWLPHQTHPDPIPFPKPPVFVRTWQQGLVHPQGSVSYSILPGRMPTAQSWPMSHLLSSPPPPFTSPSSIHNHSG